MQFSNYFCDFLDPDQMNITIQSSVDRRSGHDSTAADRTDPPGQAHSTHPPRLQTLRDTVLRIEIPLPQPPPQVPRGA